MSKLGLDGQRQTMEVLWMLRREPEGWRIAGLAPTVFPGEDPIVFNFENPQETLVKRAWLAEEYARRTAGATLEARRDETGEPSPRR
jgi:hypothetical protein